jgi:hypothetical protein
VRQKDELGNIGVHRKFAQPCWLASLFACIIDEVKTRRDVVRIESRATLEGTEVPLSITKHMEVRVRRA